MGFVLDRIYLPCVVICRDAFIARSVPSESFFAMMTHVKVLTTSSMADILLARCLAFYLRHLLFWELHPFVREIYPYHFSE